jgi:phosphinothricin acetyltransferase
MQRAGIGLGLLRQLIKVSELDGYWTLQAQMMIENNASLGIFKKVGFREVGFRERYGQLNGIWHNVVLCERRSQCAGGLGLPTKACP